MKYTKGQKGARKRTHNEAHITSTCGITPCRYVGKAWQANPSMDSKEQERRQDVGFSLLRGLWISGRAFFPHTREVFASKWAMGGFSS